MSTENPESREHPALSIAVPGTWMIVDLERLEDAPTIEALVDERVTDGSIAEESRAEAADIVTRAMVRAHEAGVRFAAVFIADDEHGPVVASVTVTSAWLDVPELADLSSDDDEQVVLRRHADQAPDTRESPYGSNVSTSTQVVLPAGPAVRIERIVSRPVTDTVSQEAYAVQYVVPVNHEGLTVTVTGVSPALRLRAELGQAFAEIAETLEITRPSEP